MPVIHACVAKKLTDDKVITMRNPERSPELTNSSDPLISERREKVLFVCDVCGVVGNLLDAIKHIVTNQFRV